MRTWAQAITTYWRSLDPAWRYALAVFLAMRLATSAIAALALGLSGAPTSPDPILRPYRGVEPIQGGWEELLLGVWQRFDTLWYLKIASQGYSAQTGDVHFPPLYPALIRLMSHLTGDQSLVAALLISNLAYVLALVLFYRLALAELGPEAAQRGMLYLAIFPTAFFFLAAYSESLFLLLALATFVFMRRGEWWKAGVAGALATLVRLQGCVLEVAFLYEYFRRADRLRARDLVATLLIPLSLGLYVLLRWAVGEAQLLPLSEPTLHARLAPPWENVLYSLQTLASGRFHQADLVNFLALVLWATLIAVSWKALPRSYNLYALSGLLLFTLRLVETQPLNSLSRYGLGLFPAFMYLGWLGRDARFHRLILYPFAALYIYLLGQFALWGWVA